ncbi:hypothetical protein [Asaia platycodi]|uniref:hypothetical protein n=1 Tax=Asaia platycodi TaxID=610243 RepID=UPI000AA6B82C|nr:hypothetical protein [Asaia platycodi]
MTKTLSIALSGQDLLDHPFLNKGLAFSRMSAMPSSCMGICRMPSNLWMSRSRRR